MSSLSRNKPKELRRDVCVVNVAAVRYVTGIAFKEIKCFNFKLRLLQYINMSGAKLGIYMNVVKSTEVLV